MRGTIIGVMLGAAGFFTLLAMWGDRLPSRATTFDVCTQRGIRYYQTIDSFPRLADGRSADEVVRERCGRSWRAFPP